jgi:apolipoprotein N-acyltransferase
VYFAGTLYWIARVMAVYGALSVWVSFLVNALLIAFLALFPALFALIVRRLVAGAGPRALAAAPIVWVAGELGRTYVLGGFPWVLLGYSQTDVLPIAQVASLIGVYGLSGIVAFVSSALGVWIALGAGPAGRRYLAAAIVLVAAVWLFGALRLSRAELTAAGAPLRVGLVQGNVDQAEKWDPRRAAEIFNSYLDLTRQAISRGAELVIWPESSTPFTFEEDRPQAELVREMARSADVEVLLGSTQIERTNPPRYFNAAFLVRPDGSTGAVYRKVHLVPFGEYVPLKSIFFFAAPLVEAVSDFTAGDGPVLLPLRGGAASTAICYEIVFPDLVRRSVVQGSQLLTTITNDAWFGRTVAPFQHFEQASMRAIENGRYLVRAANTGISGVVDPYGRTLASSGIYEPAVIVETVRLLSVRTVYSRIGDVVAYASVVATAALLIAVSAGKRTNRLR